MTKGKRDAGTEISLQNRVRNQVCELVFPFVESKQLSYVEAATACFGATAVFLALLKPEARELLSRELEANLLDHANKRAADLRSGAFDADISRSKS